MERSPKTTDTRSPLTFTISPETRWTGRGTRTLDKRFKNIRRARGKHVVTPPTLKQHVVAPPSTHFQCLASYHCAAYCPVVIVHRLPHCLQHRGSTVTVVARSANSSPIVRHPIGHGVDLSYLQCPRPESNHEWDYPTQNRSLATLQSHTKTTSFTHPTLQIAKEITCCLFPNTVVVVGRSYR